MVQWKVASKEHPPVYKAVHGNIAIGLKEKFGFPWTHKIDHPEMCLLVDEVGSDLSQKGDGHIGGAKYACEKGNVPQNQCNIQIGISRFWGSLHQQVNQCFV